MWSFDITKTAYDNLSKIPYTSAAGQSPSNPAYFQFMRLINDDSGLLCSSWYIGNMYKYSFQTGHNGEIDQLKDGYDQVSAYTPYFRVICSDIEGKRWFCEVRATSEKIRKQVISSAFDLSALSVWNTAEGVLDQFPYLSQESHGIAISDDGKKLFLLGVDGQRLLVQYTLVTPFSLASASPVTTVVPMVVFSATATHWSSFTFSPDGHRIVFVGDDKINVFELSVAWDISTMTFAGTYTSAFGSLTGLCVNDAGTKLYVSSSSTKAIYQFSLSA